MFVGLKPVRQTLGSMVRPRHTSCHTHALNVMMEACISMTHVGVRLGVGVGVYVRVIRGTIEAAS